MLAAFVPLISILHMFSALSVLASYDTCIIILLLVRPGVFYFNNGCTLVPTCCFYIPTLFAVTVFGLKTLDTCSSFSRTLWLHYNYPILRYTLTSCKDDKH